MQATVVRDASGRVIVALVTAGRSRATIKRHKAEFNAFAGFLEARGRAVPTEVDCLDFVLERSGCRLTRLREPTSSRRAQLARRPSILLMETLAGGVPVVGRRQRRRWSAVQRVSGRPGTSTWGRAGGGVTPKRPS
jgi:integrase/recombinase XerD